MNKCFTSGQIAEFVNGKLFGKEDIIITNLGPPKIATEDTLAIAFEKEHLEQMQSTKALCMLLPENVECDNKTYIQVNRPKLAMGKLLYLFYIPPENYAGIHPTAIIDPTATIGNNVCIGPYSVIGSNVVIKENTQILSNVCIGASARIGANCLIYPNVYVGDRVIVGNKVIIHAGSVIGSDGYSYITEKESNLETARTSGETGLISEQVVVKVPSIGSVIICDDVELGANCCLDRGTINDTIIGKNTKLDNSVHIAHNCIIGESCLITAQNGISGSTQIGDRCIFGGQVGIADHLKVGSDVIIMGKSGVSKNLPSKGIYGGNPAAPRKEITRQYMNIKSIAGLRDRIKIIEKELNIRDKVE